MADLSPPENPDRKENNPFWINGLPKQIRSKIRVQKRSGCWLWQGTIRPARQRQRLSRYAGRVHDTFGDPCRLERDAALPEVWDGRKGAKVAAHRFIRSVLTCVPIDDVPRLSRCDDPRCVSPHHNIEIGPPPKRSTINTPADRRRSEASSVKNHSSSEVILQLKQIRPVVELGISEAERECGLSSGSVSDRDWELYSLWDEATPDDD